MTDPKINISGGFTGNFQIGDHNTAGYAAGTGDSREVQELRAAVEDLRAQLRAHDGVDTGDAQLAEEVLDEVAAAGEPAPGKLRRAVATLTGLLTSTAGLATALETLRHAAAPWL